MIAPAIYKPTVAGSKYLLPQPSLVSYFGNGSPQSVVTLEVAEGRIKNIRLLVNPEKLGNVPPLEQVESAEDSG